MFGYSRTLNTSRRVTAGLTAGLTQRMVRRSEGTAVARNGHSADPARTRTATSAATALGCLGMGTYVR